MSVPTNHSPKNNWFTLVDLLSCRASEQDDHTAYQFLHRGEKETAKLTYKELELQAKAIASYLQSIGATGERALLLYSPGIEFIPAFFGCLYAGVVAVPAYPPRRNQKMVRLQTIVKDAQAMVVLTTASILSKVESRLADNPDLKALHWLATDEVEEKLAQTWQHPDINGKTLAFLQYTSGSTGAPKGVMLDHSNLLHNERMVEKAFGHSEQTNIVGWLPLFHDMGLIGNMLQPLYIGRACILMSPADFLQKPLRWLQAISRYKATTSGGPNFAYALCAKKISPEQKADLDLSSWDVAFNGAEPVRAETLEQFAKAFEPCGFRARAFYPCYGMAETTLFVTGGLKQDYPTIQAVKGEALEQHRVVPATNKDDSVRRIVSCGKAWLDQEVVIANPDSLTVCPAGEVGEIWVAGESVAQGYWNQPDVTERSFKAYLSDTGEGPFLRTGDLGFKQDDELFVTGRIKDIIIIKGQNYYPQDIEFTVEKSHPALKAGSNAAFSVEVKGSERLVIVQELERSYIRKLNPEAVVESICQAVTAEYNLRPFATVLIKTGSLPKTSSGKVQRYACRAKFLEGSLNVVKDWSENPIGKAQFICLQAEVESVLQTLEAGKK